MDDRPLILGVDGGGTKTVACLAQALPSVTPLTEAPPWTILGTGQSGSSNQQAVSQEQATEALQQAIEQAFADAQLDVQSVSSICLALAGCDRTADREFVHQWAEQFITCDHLSIVNDAVPLLVAGTPDQWGVALISGTGSFAWGRNEAGQTARSGGWGYLLGDEGSGFSLGQAALRAATQSADGRGPQTTLLPEILASFNCQEPAELISAVYTSPRARTDIAALAPIVLEQAAADDTIALEITADAARSLAVMVESVVRQLSIQEPFPLVFAGGLLTRSPFLQRAVQQRIQDRDLVAEPTRSLANPVVGTLQLAQQMHDR